ncbi:MAG: hypothetical protein WBF93_01405 [Pirellulales bacterium]
MYLFAAQPGLPIFALLLTAPTILVLVWLSLKFASSSDQRLTNLFSGFLFAVGSIVILGAFFDPQPSSWADKNYGFFFFALAPIGAAMGVASSVVTRHLVSRRTTRHGG